MAILTDYKYYKWIAIFPGWYIGDFVGAIAARGEDAPPQQSEASAIKAFVDTIESEEACDSVRFFADIHLCLVDDRWGSMWIYIKNSRD